MQKNVAGQKIGGQMVSATDGSAFTGAVTVYVTGDAGTQAAGSVGSGACTHEGNGYHTYAPAQAETNYDLVAFTFIGTGAVPSTVQVFTSFPQTGDAYARLGAPAGASVSADLAAVKAQTGAIETDTQDLQTQIGTDGAGLTNMPWNAAWDAEVQSEAQDAITASALATAANLATLAGYVDTEVAAILAAVDTEVAAIKAKTDYLPSATAGAAGGVFIAGANAATSVTTALTANITGNVSGSVGSVTGNVGGNVVGSVGSVSGDTKQTADVAALITTVGVAGAGLTALATQASVNTIDDFLDTEIAAILADTNELQTDLANGGRLDLLIDAIKAKTDVIPASPAAVGSEMLLTAAYDAAKTAATQASVDDLPTNAELATALGTADDATLAAIAALNNLSSAQAQAAATAALEAYDPPTNAEMVARTLLAASYFDPATDTVARVTLVDTTTTNTDMVAAAPSAATVADAVWDEALSGHAAAGSTGAALTAASAAGDPWSTALPGAYRAGTAGRVLSDIKVVAPDNKPTVSVGGQTSANVTLWKGDAVADLVNGAVPSNLLRWLDGDVSEQLPQVIPIIDDGEGTQQLTQQVLRDAMKLAPSAGAAEAGSVDALLAGIEEDTGTTLPATLALEATAQAVLAVIGAGSGTGLYTDTITNGSAPLDGVRVQLSTDEAGEHRVYETFTNALGVFVLRPDPGTYYRWLDLAGYAFTQGVEVEVPEL